MRSEKASFFPGLVRGLETCLKDIFQEGYYADKVLARHFKLNKKWGKRDRQFLAETVYDMTRWWRRLALIDGQGWVPESYFLRWAAYEKWKNDSDVNDFLQNSFSLNIQIPEEKSQPSNLGDAESFPDWFVEKLASDHGSEVGKGLIKALNQPASVYLRTNSLKTTPDELRATLAAEEVVLDEEKWSDAPAALRLKVRKNVFSTKAFKDGLFEVQDLASQKVAALLNPVAGERVADVCAGAGGKTLHLAMLMKNKGSLLAGDVYEKKIEELRLRARRAGVSNLRAVVFEGTKDLKKHKGMFDAVLIDAPCSGSGVIRRNPDAKWKMTVDDLAKLIPLQKEILENYSKFVKSGGRMVYATCSLFNDENGKQVQEFLNTHPEFSLVKELTTRPDLRDEDGFYVALLIKK